MMRLFFLFSCFLITSSSFAQQKLTPSNAESTVGFTIKNFGIGVDGTLKNLKGTIVINTAQLAASSANVTVDVATINTGNNKRDKHLKEDDYFDAVKYPTIRLQSTSIEAAQTPGEFVFTGNLTIRAVTKIVSFPFTIVPLGKKYIMAANFSIDRRDFNVGSNSAVLGDNVNVKLNIIAE